MALSSPSTAPSYPGLSSSLSSFLSTLQCHIDDSSSSLPSSPSQNLYSDSQDSAQNAGQFRNLEDSQQVNQCLESNLGSDTLLGYLQILDPEPLGQGLYDMTFSPHPYPMSAEARPLQEEQTRPEPFMSAAWEAEQLQLLLGITANDTEQPCLEQRGNVARKEAARLTALPFPAAAEIKKPDAKEAFVHPGFYSLSSQGSSSSNSSSSLSSPSPTPPQMARKRSLQEEGTNGCRRPVDGHHHHLLPCGTDIRRHSLDTQLSSKAMPELQPHSWAFTTPPKSPSNASLHFISQLQQQRQHQQKLSDQTDVPPGQPYMAAISSLQPFPFLQHSLISRHQRSPAPKMSSMPPSPSPSSLLLSPSGSPQQQQRKRRASKARIGSFAPGMSFYESGLQYPLQFPINAVPPPLQQHHHRQHQHQYQPYLQPPYPTQTSANFHKQLRHHHFHHQQQLPLLPPPQQQHPRAQFSHQHPFSPRATTTGTNGSPSYRRNPGEVPSSTLPPDHFVFQEALFGIRRGYSLSTPLAAIADAAAAATAATAAARRRSEPAIMSDMSLKASPVWTSTLTPSASSSSSSSSPTSRSLITSPPSLPLAIKQVGPQFARPAPYSSTNMPPAPAESATALKEEEGYEKPAETAIAGQATTTTITTTTNTTADNTAAAATQEAEDLSAAAAFAQSLSTVTTLDPAATKLIDQLRLQEYLRMVQPTTTSSSPSSAMASSIIASSTLF